MGSFTIRSMESGILFDLMTSNGDALGTSGFYCTRSACIHGTESVKKRSQTRNIEDQTVSEFTALTFPKFEIYKDEGGVFGFRLLSRNGEMIFSGGGYESKTKCLEGIEQVRRNAPLASLNFLCEI